jgi:diaminohydroxyphosphoribosylaminopyrimidine deaminase/5-amino-6-(5-phosphoribosylamino)uracil reductase
MVGCVIVKHDRIIGEGFHARYGGPHAEPQALASCTDSPQGATAYVTLEPCCHVDKQTPPCAPRLIQSGIARVVYGCLDPNPSVNGQGVRMLREAGVGVDGPVLEASCRQLIAPFIARTAHQRPYVTLKWAQTRDGKIAGAMGKAIRITNAASDDVVHAVRGRVDAIAVGTNTLLNDDPLLTARTDRPDRTPLRVVLSNMLKIPTNCRLVETARQVPVVVYCIERSLAENARLVEKLRAMGVAFVGLPDRGAGRFALPDVLADLWTRGVTHLLIEPGPTLAGALLGRNQADRVWVFESGKALNEPSAPSGPVIPLDYHRSGVVALSGDTLTEYLNPSSEVFFAAEPSADFRIVAGVG